MPGSTLPIVYPTLADSLSDIVAKLVLAISIIQADIEPKVSAGELNIDTELSMGGAPLTNVGGVRLIGGGSSVVGTIYMDSELKVVTSAGVVQVTSLGGLNVTALGTIGGDYGGANPATVVYHDLSGQFRFKEDVGNWADLSFEKAVLNGALASVTLGVEATLASDKTLLFKSFPAGIGMFAYQSASNTLVDASTVTPTVGAMIFGGDIDVAGNKVKHTNYISTYGFTKGDVIDSGGSVGTTIGVGGVVIPALVDTYLKLPMLGGKDRVKIVTVYNGLVGAGVATLYKIDQSGTYTPVAGAQNISPVGNTWTLTPTTPAVNTGYSYALKIVGHLTLTTPVYNADIAYDVA